MVQICLNDWDKHHKELTSPTELSYWNVRSEEYIVLGKFISFFFKFDGDVVKTNKIWFHGPIGRFTELLSISDKQIKSKIKLNHFKTDMI